jgi:hypothetical protein
MGTMKRFWSKVDRRGPDECWPWRGGTNGKQGYGLFWLGEHKPVLAHRWVYEHVVGPSPPGRGYHGTCVLHRCDNRLCVNPAHLFLGTHADNMADMSAKGRATSPRQLGESNPNAKLTAEQIEQIRRTYTGRWGEQSELGRQYGVSATTIARHVRA